MLPCRRASQLISDAMDRRLSLREQALLRLHLLLCGACRIYRRHLALIRRAMGGGGGTSDDPVASAVFQLSAAARDRIRHALDRRR